MVNKTKCLSTQLLNKLKTQNDLTESSFNNKLRRVFSYKIWYVTYSMQTLEAYNIFKFGKATHEVLVKDKFEVLVNNKTEWM